MDKNERSKIFKRINQIKKENKNYQLKYGKNESSKSDGYYALSKEYVDSLLKKVANELGIKL